MGDAMPSAEDDKATVWLYGLRAVVETRSIGSFYSKCLC